MSLLAALTSVLVTAALLSFVNYRLLRLPSGIGVTLLVLAGSLVLLAARGLGLPVRGWATEVVMRLDFQSLVLDVMLAFLLFAGSLNVAQDLRQLIDQRWSVGLLATAGVVASTVLVGGFTWTICKALHVPLTTGECLLFGALISPTDPVAVLAILRLAGVPKPVEVQMAGEALFNDGIGVVTFSVILGVLASTHGQSAADVADVAWVLARQVVGSLALGLALGWVAFLMLRSVDEYRVEVLLTVGLAAGLYGLASRLRMSGPLAVVAAGLIVGGVGRAKAMSARTLSHLDSFWEVVDEVLNVVLFLLVGLEIVVMPLNAAIIVVGLVAALLVLLARFLSVGGTALALRRLRPFPPHAVKILTWGGLRGGLSLAMALSLGDSVPGRRTIHAITYVVVVFSILVQGLTFGRMIRRLPAQPAPKS